MEKKKAIYLGKQEWPGRDFVHLVTDLRTTSTREYDPDRHEIVAVSILVKDDHMEMEGEKMKPKKETPVSIYPPKGMRNELAQEVREQDVSLNQYVLLLLARRRELKEMKERTRLNLMD